MQSFIQILKLDGQMDKRTDGRTDGRTLPQYDTYNIEGYLRWKIIWEEKQDQTLG